MEIRKTADYERKFSRIGFMIKDLHERYNNVIKFNDGEAFDNIPIYKTLIKNDLHKGILHIKEWLDKKYFSTNNTPLGTYIHEKFSELEKKLDDGYSDEQKQGALKTILSTICDSLDNIEPKLNYNL